jgi:glycine cleavage system aminomethyltransferase T
MGPKSRALLEKVSGADLSNAAFPFGTSQEIEIGYARVRASPHHLCRRTGLGALHPGGIRRACLRNPAGRRTGVQSRPRRHAHHEQLPHGKGYRHWGHDMSDEETPLEAGLGFGVAWDKPGGFIGRDALLKQREIKVLPKRMVPLPLMTPATLPDDLS